MTPEQLKASILQSAIQGKLVEQRQEEGTGEELYLQIQAEKQRLIKEKKIKKKKALAEITEDEIPFDIPDSWKWVKLGDCTGYDQTKEKVSPKDITGDMWSLDLEDIQKDTGAILVKTKASERKINGDKVKFHKGQVLYSKLRPYLKKILVAPDDGICTPELVPFDTYLIDEHYIAYVLKSPHIDYVINSVTYGVKMPRVGTATMTNLLIPLPSLAEQKRIVAKIEELLPYVDRYAIAYEKLEQFNAKFPEDMKKSILQYAIQGKLVEQRPQEGTGEELYQQIQSEKQKLIKDGKIKKEKLLGEIAVDEIPFDIPESWKWVRLGDLANINGGFAFKSTNYTPEGVRVIRISDFNEMGFVNDKIVRYPYDDSLSQYVLDVKNILLCMTGGTVGKSLFITKLDEKMVVNQRVATIKINSVLPEYVYQVILAPITQKVIQDSKNSTNDNISMDTIKGFLIPLPPIDEQKRIVAKLEEILPLCERMK